MALLFVDGFDHYATADIVKKYNSTTGTGITINAAAGRRGGGALRFAYSSGAALSVLKNVTSGASFIVGFAISIASLPSSSASLLAFVDSTTTQISLLLNADGTLSVVRGVSTAVTNGTSAATIPLNAFTYLEIKVTIADSIAASSCVVKINGAAVITVATGQDLQATANAFANVVRLCNFSSGNLTVALLDDLYICNTAGSTNNDFLGDSRVDTLYPTGAGNYTQFTPLSGANWTNVDEASVNTTDYNDGTTVGHRDSYAMGDLAALTSQTVYGVQVSAALNKDDAGSKSASTMVRSSSTDGDGATAVLGTAQAIVTEVYETNPNGSVAWTETTVNAMEAGVKVVA